MDIDELYSKATGFEPYGYQCRVAEEGLPELLQVPTGCGKTEAVGWDGSIADVCTRTSKSALLRPTGLSLRCRCEPS